MKIDKSYYTSISVSADEKTGVAFPGRAKMGATARLHTAQMLVPDGVLTAEGLAQVALNVMYSEVGIDEERHTWTDGTLTFADLPDRWRQEIITSLEADYADA